ncbi:MAG: c-type cytochrome [Gammaproteobacteria bacterium]
MRLIARAASVAALMALGALMLPASAARPVPEDVAAPGPGRELFVAHCSSCHSIDYIRMHAPFGTRALWEASVAKMRNAFKAPVNDEDARAIVEYLTVAYGPQSPSADDRK